MVLLTETTVTTVAPLGREHPARDAVRRGSRAMARRSAFLRRAVVQAPLISRWNDSRYDVRLARHATNVPPVSVAQRAVLAELATAGVAVRSADLPADVVDSADGFARMLSKKDIDTPCVLATPAELAQDPRLFAHGLSEHLLDLAECHIGLPVRYLGIEVKRERTKSATGFGHQIIRRWHLDHEDRRILKVIVYLNDVDSETGPFGYIHKSHSAAILESGNGRNLQTVSDDDMHAVVPRQRWNHVTGGRMTAIHVDTGQVFHRVFPPTASERYSVTFAYCSRTPYYTYPHLMLPRPSILQLRQRLSQRQWDALCVGRGRRAH